MNDVRTEQKYEVYAKLFGRVELENHCGHSTETMTRDPAPWLMMKYLLVSPKKAASLDELYQTVWEKDGFAVKEQNLNVRLFRVREILAPLKLNGAKDLLLRDGDRFWINPDYTIHSDAELFLELMEQRRALPLDDPRGLDICIRGLEIFDAPIFQFTGMSPWLAGIRGALCEEYMALARDTLDRGKRLGDDRALAILSERAPVIIPQDKAFHNNLLCYLEETGRLVESASYQFLLEQAEMDTAADARPVADRRTARRAAASRTESARKRSAPVRPNSGRRTGRVAAEL